MKIWEARLQLVLDDEDYYRLFFRFEEKEGEYEKKSNNYWESKRGGWINGIPVKMEVKKFYDNYRVSQGFERELNESELEQVKKDMKQLILSRLQQEHEEFLYFHNKKVSALDNVEVRG